MTVSYFIPYMLCFSEILSESMRCGSQSSHTVRLHGQGRRSPGLSLSLRPAGTTVMPLCCSDLATGDTR